MLGSPDTPADENGQFDLEAELDKLFKQREPSLKNSDGDAVGELLRSSVEKMVAGDAIMD